MWKLKDTGRQESRCKVGGSRKERGGGPRAARLLGAFLSLDSFDYLLTANQVLVLR